MPRDPLAPNTDDSLALRAFDILRRRRLLAIAVFATVLAAAISFTQHLPDLYQAGAVVLVERQVAESFVRPAVTGELESRLHVIKQETLSRQRLTDLINRFDLYPEIRKKDGFESALDQMRHDIQIETTGPEQVSARSKTVAFRLSFTNGDRQKVADVTNAIAAFYVNQNNQIRSQEAIQTSEFLKAQLDDAKKALDREVATLRAYTADHSGELPEQVGVNLATLERLNTQLRINADQQIRTMEQREKLLESIPDMASIGLKGDDAAGSAEWLEKAKRLTTMREQLATLETQFTAKHPDVMKLKDQIAALEKDLSVKDNAEEKKASDAIDKTNQLKTLTTARRRQLEGLDAELERLKKEEADTRAAMGGFERRLSNAPERQQEYTLMSRGYQSAKEQYDTLLKKYDEARLAESMETDRQGEQFRILESAIPPEGPMAPNRMRLMIMGFLLAVAFAGLAVLALEQLDASFHTVDELRDFTSVPVLVTIPKMLESPQKRAFRLALAAVSIVAVVAVAATASGHLASSNEQLVRLFVRG